MPTPPRASESKDEYIQRCISYLVRTEGKSQAQATAICLSLYKQSKVKPKRRSRKKRQTPIKRTK
jgi:hypothetical protein